ncbi:MAG: hypothetical protein AB2L21_06715 [Anaerolineaceae bacterium]
MIIFLLSWLRDSGQLGARKNIQYLQKLGDEKINSCDEHNSHSTKSANTSPTKLGKLPRSPWFFAIQSNQMANPHKAFLIAAIFLLLLPSLSACSSESEESLPLEAYEDPYGRFTFAIPEDWQSTSESDTSVLSLTPPDYTGAISELHVVVFTAPTFSMDTQEHVEETTALFEPFLKEYLDDSYEVINEGEAKVDKRPALLLDFAKPYEDGYLSGRVVMVAMPAYALAFIGLADSETWDTFLPTFRKMLEEFHLISAYEITPTP